MNKLFKVAIIMALTLVLAVMAGCGKGGTANTTNQNNTTDAANTVSKKEAKQGDKDSMSKAEFDKIKNGMTKDEVDQLVGGKGKLQDQSGDEDQKTEVYKYKGEGTVGANARITFKNGKVKDKQQSELK